METPLTCSSIALSEILYLIDAFGKCLYFWENVRQKIAIMNFNSIVFLLTIMTLIFLSSCKHRTTARFEIMNNTEVLIDSINITSSNNNSNPDYLQLGPGQSQTYYYDMTDLPKVDGHYILTYRDSTNHSSRFGYFSNGFPMEKVTNVFFEKDTVVIDQIFNKL